MEKWPIYQRPLQRPGNDAACVNGAYVVLPWGRLGSRIAFLRRGVEGSYHPLRHPCFIRHQAGMGMRKLQKLANRLNARMNVSAHEAGALKADWLTMFRNAPIEAWEYEEWMEGRRFLARHRIPYGATSKAGVVCSAPAPRGYLIMEAKMNGAPLNAGPAVGSLRYWHLVAFHELRWIEAVRGDGYNGKLSVRERRAKLVSDTGYALTNAAAEFNKCSRWEEHFAARRGDPREAARIKAIPLAERVAEARKLRRRRKTLLRKHLLAIAAYWSHFEVE